MPVSLQFQEDTITASISTTEVVTHWEALIHLCRPVESTVSSPLQVELAPGLNLGWCHKLLEAGAG